MSKGWFEENMEDPAFVAALAQEELILEATELICEVMEASGVTRKELAARIGKSPAFITQVLGGRNITLRTLADLSRALGFTIRMVATPGQA